MFRRIVISLLVLSALVGLAFVSSTLLDQERISSVLVSDVGDKGGDIAVLVLGQVAAGEGGRWHLAPGLVDTAAIAYYRQETNTVNFISIPRDLYGTFGDSEIKLNRIYNEGRIDSFLAKLEEITSVPVDKYLVLNLETVAEAINALGGIDVDLPEAVTDPVTGYTLPAGSNRLNGDDAVWLIRNRYAPEGDFFREKNQHLVTQAVFKKFENLSSIGKTAFAFRLLPRLTDSTANFRVGELIGQVRNIEDVNFNSVVLDFETKLLESSQVTAGGDAYVLIPTAGIDQYDKIREYIRSQIR